MAEAWSQPYALIELATGTVAGTYETERAALQAVIASIEQHGEAAVAGLALAYRMPGDVYPIAEGAALASRALDAAQGNAYAVALATAELHAQWEQTERTSREPPA